MHRAATQADTTPYWAELAPFPRFPKLQADERVDVLIVGGGITGLSAAYLLAATGRSVALLERARCAQADTGHTTAHLTMVTDKSLTELVKNFGREQAQAIWDGGLAAISQIEAIARDEAIASGFEWVDGYLHAAGPARADRATLEKEAATAADLGVDATLIENTPLFGTPGIRFDGQARFHPRKYLAGLARAVVARGGHIYEHSDAQEFLDSPLRVRTNGHTITCDDIVLATHNPLVGITNMASATIFQTKLALYTSYVVAARVNRGQVPDALFWDTGEPYHYLRIERRRDRDVVIYGGEDHKTGQADNTEQCYNRLEERLTSLIPGLELTHRWSGQVIETPDGLPYIGETSPHQFTATGFSGNGMTFGTLGAMMARDHIVGRTNPWSEIFDAGRSALRKGIWQYVKENVDFPYYLFRDRMGSAEATSLRAVKEGEGKVLELNGERVAASRLNGRTIVRSAVCTHMGCIVGWNEAERTWDCPCHGSRFTPTGEAVGGPAESPLPEIRPK
jgi:glycine/D-amino acid oxidase-like deaminating enzyme/nitrite reductase/ring-hydroxylating ferredoxin subunit